MMISGNSIPLDAIWFNFAAGAVEKIVLESGNDYEVL